MEATASIEEDFRFLEERLLQSDARQSAVELDALLADDFLEFGSSGRVYDKPQVIAALLTETLSSISLTDFRTKVLAPNVVLVTYQAICTNTTATAAVRSLRSSLWRLADGRWQLVFHQGTPLKTE